MWDIRKDSIIIKLQNFAYTQKVCTLGLILALVLVLVPTDTILAEVWGDMSEPGRDHTLSSQVHQRAVSTTPGTPPAHVGKDLGQGGKIPLSRSTPADLFAMGLRDGEFSSNASKVERNLLQARLQRPEGLVDVLWVFILATVVKVLLMPAYRSTDFEVHRNWLALTHSLPMHKWYFEDTSEWTLDYPPLFAYFECGLSYIAKLFDPAMLVVKNLNYASRMTIIFQRLSVIASDFILMIGIIMWSKTWSRTRVTECAHSRGKFAIVAGLTFLNPGLLMVDHIHFQYNGMLLGLLLISLSLVRMERNLRALSVFCALILAKHIFFYVVPVFGVYLLGHYCWTVPAVVSARHLQRCRRKINHKDDVNNIDSSSSEADEDTNPYTNDVQTSQGGDVRGSSFDNESSRCCCLCCSKCCCQDCCCDKSTNEYSHSKRVNISTRQRTLSEDINIHVSGQFQSLNFFALVAVSLAALILAFGPIFLSSVLHDRQAQDGFTFADIFASVSKQSSQIMSRLFPWQRGLCHAYWAPNIWAWYSAADRTLIRAVRILKLPFISNTTAITASASTTGGLVKISSMVVLPNIKPAFTFLVTILSMLPVLWKVSNSKV